MQPLPSDASPRPPEDFLERLLAVVTTKPARRVFEQLRLDAPQLFHELGNEKLGKLTAFLEKRLPRAFHK
jgi:hypothetical protein